jgi:hypothetical protein
MGHRSLVIATLLGVVSTGSAAFFSLPDTITVRIVDEASGKGLAPVYAVADETFTAPAPGHGSINHCVRSGAAVGLSSDGARLALPFASRGGFTGLSGGSQRVRAYTPGHCTLPQYSVNGSVQEFRARRNTDPVEHRIRQIGEALQSALEVGCGSVVASGTEEARREITSAMLEEAKGIAKTPYERYLAERVALWASGQSPDNARMPYGRSFAIVEESRLSRPISWNELNTTCRNCQVTAADIRAALGAGKPAPRYSLVCRNPGECGLERRNFNGATYLYELIEDGDAARVRPLLEAGADPNAQRYPGGSTGLDRLLGETHQKGAETAQRALDTIRLLAKDGRATVSAQSSASIRRKASATTDVTHRDLLLSIATALDTFPGRATFTPVCPVRQTGQLPFDPRGY